MSEPGRWLLASKAAALFHVVVFLIFGQIVESCRIEKTALAFPLCTAGIGVGDRCEEHQRRFAGQHLFRNLLVHKQWIGEWKDGFLTGRNKIVLRKLNSFSFVFAKPFVRIRLREWHAHGNAAEFDGFDERGAPSIVNQMEPAHQMAGSRFIYLCSNLEPRSAIKLHLLHGGLSLASLPSCDSKTETGGRCQQSIKYHLPALKFLHYLGMGLCLLCDFACAFFGTKWIGDLPNSVQDSDWYQLGGYALLLASIALSGCFVWFLATCPK